MSSKLDVRLLTTEDMRKVSKKKPLQVALKKCTDELLYKIVELIK